MMFKTELHLHSAEVSDCARVFSKDIADTYAAHGYSTVVITNHMSQYTFSSKRNGARENMTWEEKVDFYLNGYYSLKEAANGRFNVLLGMELRFYDSANDYLIYGVTEDFLRSNGDLMQLKNAKGLRPLIDENGLLLYQAHPFRNGMQVTNPAYLDGIEVFNGHLDHDSRNDVAEIWADKFDLKRTSGSDYHYPAQTPNAGILTDFEIQDNETLVSTLKSGQFMLLKGQ
ncbi:MAG: transposase [Clostridia bacterium]|nr:transposase [Clostridia bacterium]